MQTDVILEIINNYGIPWFLIIGGALFLQNMFSKIWKWYTGTYWPKQEEIKERETEVLRQIGESLLLLKQLLQEINSKVDQVNRKLDSTTGQIENLDKRVSFLESRLEQGQTPL